MRNNQPVTQREHHLTDDDVIISTTTEKGVITSVNEDFIRISGFNEDELINQAHNLVRHPDMPQAAFKDMWDVIVRDKPWMGLVKNRCKNGDHYYVDAYVTPIYTNGRITGYQSVRVKPDRDVVNRADKLYAALSNGGLGWWHNFLPQNLSYKLKAGLLGFAVSLPAIISAAMGGDWVLAVITLLLALGLSYWFVQPLLALATTSKQTFENAVAQQVYTGRADELGQLELVIKAQRAQNRTILGRVKHPKWSRWPQPCMK